MTISADTIRAAATGVLVENDTGTLIRAAPRLYPHQWSWDAAFISVGLAHRSVPRAIVEWRTIFGAQWTTGMLPHIVFAEAPDYFPGPDVWGTQEAVARPAGIQTSGICQPPVHALCVEQVALIARAKGGADAAQIEEFIADAVPRLARWHAWLSRARDPERSGLIEIHHGWESGMDNSPRFDSVYAGVDVREPAVLKRTDLVHASAAERPTDAEYQRYLWLIHQLRSVAYDDARAVEVIDFRCGDVFITACLAVSSEALARLADSIGDVQRAASERRRAARCREAVLASVDPATGLCRDFDYRAGRWLDVPSIAGFALLICDGPTDAVLRQRALLTGPHWMGHPQNRHPLPGSVSLDDPGCQPRAYWRGPVWPIMNWFFAHCALGRGDVELAAALRRAGLDQLSGLEFGEYYEPRTGEALGSHRQSWTAMAALDWLTAARWAGAGD